MQILIYSTWQSEKGLVGQAVDIAVRNGYRSIDCAWLYRNEDEIGATLETLFKEGVVKREELFITSKLSYVKCITHTRPFILQSLFLEELIIMLKMLRSAVAIHSRISNLTTLIFTWCVCILSMH